MKFYLSSLGIPNLSAFEEFVGKKANEIKFALIFDAKDYKPAEERAQKFKETFEYFQNLGFQVEEIKLSEYTHSEDLLKKLKEFDVVWFNGGNTYYLRWAVSESGADTILKEVLQSGVVYGGDSAGAVLVTPTLKYYDTADDPSVAPRVLYDGLGLVDFTLLPHWGSGEFDDVLGGIEENLQKDGYQTIRLTNDEYLLVEDGHILT